jgi:hypothetical protein
MLTARTRAWAQPVDRCRAQPHANCEGCQLQAEKQLTASWTLMKDRLPTTVPIDAWLVANLPDGAKVRRPRQRLVPLGAKLGSRPTKPGG